MRRAIVHVLLGLAVAGAACDSNPLNPQPLPPVGGGPNATTGANDAGEDGSLAIVGTSGSSGGSASSGGFNLTADGAAANGGSDAAPEIPAEASAEGGGTGDAAEPPDGAPGDSGSAGDSSTGDVEAQDAEHGPAADAGSEASVTSDAAAD